MKIDRLELLIFKVVISAISLILVANYLYVGSTTYGIRAFIVFLQVIIFAFSFIQGNDT